MARTRKFAECGSDEKMRWLALHPSIHSPQVSLKLKKLVKNILSKGQWIFNAKKTLYSPTKEGIYEEMPEFWSLHENNCV